jgi:hypothetical protein
MVATTSMLGHHLLFPLVSPRLMPSSLSCWCLRLPIVTIQPSLNRGGLFVTGVRLPVAKARTETDAERE